MNSLVGMLGCPGCFITFLTFTGTICNEWRLDFCARLCPWLTYRDVRGEMDTGWAVPEPETD